MHNYVPAILSILVVSAFIFRNQGKPVLQFFALIMISYLSAFPLLNYVLRNGLFMDSFFYYQWIILLFFILPLVMTMEIVGSRSMFSNMGVVREDFSGKVPYRVSVLLPYILLIFIAVFWYVVVRYGLFVRRLGFEALQERTAGVPLILLFIYRATVETSFFVIAYVGILLRYCDRRLVNVSVYRLAFYAYVATFIVYFGVNSRMQVILLLVTIVCTTPALAAFLFKKIGIVPLAAGMLSTLVGLTLLRELVLEDNRRIYGDSLTEALTGVAKLVAARADSTTILYRIHEAGHNPWIPNFSGINHLYVFYKSFFFDQSTYSSIKASLVTSPSVEIVNHYLYTQQVDFPKSMMLDVLLSFGVPGVFVVAILLGLAFCFIQRGVVNAVHFSIYSIAALYIMPVMLEFEKETIGVFLSLVKWAPIFVLMFLLRPRVRRPVYIPPIPGA